MQAPFSHVGPTQLTYGPGALDRLAKARPLRRAARLLVVADATMVELGFVERVTGLLGERVALVDTDAVPDACADHVDRLGATMVAEGIDGVVAIGGGSVLDTAKAAAAVCARTHKDGTQVRIRALTGVSQVRTPLLPIVAIPTTAGTGSEATQFAVVKDHGAREKLVLVDPVLIPPFAIVDPTLATGLPAAVTAASGLDALTHAFEAVASRMHNPVGDALATEAIRRIVADRALERAMADGSDVDARGDMMLAAFLAGQAVSSNMLGVSHALAHALGAHFGVAHGVANGMFLADVVRFNAPKATAAYSRVATALGITDTPAVQIEALAQTIERLAFDVCGLPRSLRAFDVTLEDLEALADEAFRDPDLATNPVRVKEPSALKALFAARLLD